MIENNKNWYQSKIALLVEFCLQHYSDHFFQWEEKKIFCYIMSSFLHFFLPIEKNDYARIFLTTTSKLLKFI